MRKKRAQSERILDSMIMAGIPIAVLYWILDSILKIFFYNQYNLVAVLLGEDIYELYTRIIVLCLLLIFGAHAQYSINRLKHARDNLDRNEKDHRKFIENLNAGIFRCTIDSNGRFIRANRAIAAMFGYTSAAEFKNSNVLDIFPSFAELKQFMDGLCENHHIRGKELILVKRSGQKIWVSCSASTARDVRGTIRYIDGVMEDITERKQSEEALRTKEEKYRLLVNHAPAGIFEMDMATAEFRSLNDVLCEMTGYSHRELIRKKCYEILAEDSRKHFFMALVKLHSHEKIAPAAELEIRKKDGTIFPAAFTTRYHYKFGQLESATVVVHDITRRKQIEREKQLLQMQLFRAQKMEAIGTLAGGIAHDFNNLLMAIQGHVSLMMASTDYLHPYLKHFFAIENYIKSAADLTRKLLGFAQGKQNEKKSVRLNSIVNEQIHIFVESRKDIQIHAHYEENLWPTVADSIQVKQVVLNLILNAIQAMPEGGHLHVRTQNRLLETDRALPKPAKAGRYVALTITDTGIGMDTETQQRIFEPFFTTKTMGPQKGSGLGLATAYGIVQNHGGFITVDSKPQEGSAFTVFLPATSPKKNDPATSRPKPATQPAETVLAIDSESEVLEALGKMLNRLGYQVLKATSGKHGLALVHKNNDRVDLVILDAGLPDFNRRQLMVELKKINPNVRILPAGHMDEPATKPAEAGGFLSKPFSLSQLSKELQAVLG